MTEELFNMIEYQVKQTGRTYWACRSCTNYAEGMHHRMKQIEEKLAEVKQSCSKNEEGLSQVQAEVGRLAEKVEKQAKDASEATSSKEDSVYEEIREREMRRANVVIHGMKEAPLECKGRERWDWDRDSCWNLFRALKLDMPKDCIRFVRRVGDAETQPRPLILGFNEEGDRRRLLRCDTRNTPFSDVDIGPDLTKKQRQEEINMKAEAVRRNMRMEEADRAKNLAWQVVGPRGEKRLIKVYVDMEKERLNGDSGNRGRGGAARRGRGGRTPPAATGSNTTPLGARDARTEDMEVEGEPREDTNMEETGPNTGRRGRGRPPGMRHLGERSRLDSTAKRKDRAVGGEDEEDDSLPPPAKAKH
jgi:hypothetical protein